jgi:hypothetical protein
MTLIRTAPRSAVFVPHTLETLVKHAFAGLKRVAGDGFTPGLNKIIPGHPDTQPQEHDYTQGDGSNSCGTTALFSASSAWAG